MLLGSNRNNCGQIFKMDFSCIVAVDVAVAISPVLFCKQRLDNISNVIFHRWPRSQSDVSSSIFFECPPLLISSFRIDKSNIGFWLISSSISQPNLFDAAIFSVPSSSIVSPDEENKRWCDEPLLMISG